MSKVCSTNKVKKRQFIKEPWQLFQRPSCTSALFILYGICMSTYPMKKKCHHWPCSAHNRRKIFQQNAFKSSNKVNMLTELSVTGGSHWVFMLCGMNNEWSNEVVGHFKFFEEPAKNTCVRLLFACVISSNKLASPQAHCWDTPHTRKFKGGPPVGHNAQRSGLQKSLVQWMC